jgi:hypothetical protein
LRQPAINEHRQSAGTVLLSSSLSGAINGGVHDQSRGASVARRALQSPRRGLFRSSSRGKVAPTSPGLLGIGRPATRAFSAHQNVPSFAQSAAAFFGFLTLSQAAPQKWAVYQKLCSNLTGRQPAELGAFCRTTGMAHGQGTVGSFGACHDRYLFRYRSHAHRSRSKNRLRT